MGIQRAGTVTALSVRPQAAETTEDLDSIPILEILEIRRHHLLAALVKELGFVSCSAVSKTHGCIRSPGRIDGA